MNKSFAKIRHIQEANIKAEKRLLREGLLKKLNVPDMIKQLNQLPNKTAYVVAEGDTLVFIINNQRIGLDCTAPSSNSSGAPASQPAPASQGGATTNTNI